MIELSDKAQRLKDFFTESIDRDTEAFNKLMDAFSLPKGTDEEKALRDKAIMDATKEATLVPFAVLEKTKEAAELALTVVEKGNQNSLSDAGVAGLTAAAAAEGALYNVMINLEGIDDEEFNQETAKKAVKINKEVQKIVTKIKSILHEKLKIK
jgi:glutamate formiminotransferase/formiminotetrahydrofolate cyclodeaminase